MRPLFERFQRFAIAARPFESLAQTPCLLPIWTPLIEQAAERDYEIKRRLLIAVDHLAKLSNVVRERRPFARGTMQRRLLEHEAHPSE